MSPAPETFDFRFNNFPLQLALQLLGADLSANLTSRCASRMCDGKDVMWKHQRWFCIDTETTGLDPGRDKIVQIGGVWYQNGHVLKVARDLINPGIPIPAVATRIHGITDTVVQASPSIAQIAPSFLHGVNQAQILIGYNWPFDDDFLWEGLGEAWGQVCHNKLIIDVLAAARRALPELPRHRMVDVALALGVPRVGLAHEAAADAITTCHILFRLMPYLPDQAHMVGALGHELAVERTVRVAERVFRNSKRVERESKQREKEEAQRLKVASKEAKRRQQEQIIEEHEASVRRAKAYHLHRIKSYDWAHAEQTSGEDGSYEQWLAQLARCVRANTSGAAEMAMEHLFKDAAQDIPLEASRAAADGTAIVVLGMADATQAVPTKSPRAMASGEVKWQDMSKRTALRLYQDHVCSWILRAAAEVYAFLPTIQVVIVDARVSALNTATGHLDHKLIVSVKFEREAFEALNLPKVDPSDCVEGMTHAMKFSSRTGFAEVSSLARTISQGSDK